MPHSRQHCDPATLAPRPSEVASGSLVTLPSVKSRWRRVSSSCISTWVDLVNLLKPSQEEQAASSQAFPSQVKYSTEQNRRRGRVAGQLLPLPLPPAVTPGPGPATHYESSASRPASPGLGVADLPPAHLQLSALVPSPRVGHQQRRQVKSSAMQSTPVEASHATPRQVKPSQAKPQAKPGHKPSQAKPSNTKPRDAKSSHVKSRHVKSRDV